MQATGAQQGNLDEVASLETTAGAMFSLSLCCFVTKDVLFQLPTPHLRSSSIFVKSQSNSFHPCWPGWVYAARSCWHGNKTGWEEGSATSMLSNGCAAPSSQPGPLPGVNAQLLCPHHHQCSACLLGARPHMGRSFPEPS